MLVEVEEEQLVQFLRLPVDLVAVAFDLGPLTFTLNVLTLVGVAIVALIARSWI